MNPGVGQEEGQGERETRTPEFVGRSFPTGLVRLRPLAAEAGVWLRRALNPKSQPLCPLVCDGQAWLAPDEARTSLGRLRG